MRNHHLIYIISLPLLFLTFTLKAQEKLKQSFYEFHEKLDSLPSCQSFYLNDSLKFRLVGDTFCYKENCLECVHVIVDNNFNTMGRLYLSINKNGDIEELRYYESGKEKLRYRQRDDEKYPTIYPKSVGYRTKNGKWKIKKL